MQQLMTDQPPTFPAFDLGAIAARMSEMNRIYYCTQETVDPMIILVITAGEYNPAHLLLHPDTLLRLMSAAGDKTWIPVSEYQRSLI